MSEISASYAACPLEVGGLYGSFWMHFGRKRPKVSGLDILFPTTGSLSTRETGSHTYRDKFEGAV